MQWTIHQIDQQYENGQLVPTTAHWRCSHTEGEFGGTVYSTASVRGLTDLKLDSVLSHLWANGVDKQATEQACQAQLEHQRTQASIEKIEQMQSDDVPDVKYQGVEFQGVMCSATKEDQTGLIAVLMAYQLQGAKFQPTEYKFVNGSSLVLDRSNIQAFIQKWMPFRQGFFKPVPAAAP